ncbi:uncharacterized protein LOC103575539 [Microplitis demolitor]|uniref:uncharacterized protein LOC103575539 n=1 Tax=Microplitis demolitor TaxID=69319 RepID=UPI00235B64EC|nr:uncharacterized protein LOC103575539 [Microplitis demolitor]
MYKKFFHIFHCVFMILIIKKSNAQNSQENICFTSDYQRGECIDIRECPDLVALLQVKPKTPEIFKTLRNSQCGFDGRYPKVCCALRYQAWMPPITRVISTTEAYNRIRENTNLNSLVDQLPSDCGRDLSVRIIGGERTSLDEFPWMALLEYEKPTGRKTGCGGVLISDRYVLTAAHCVNQEDLPKSWRLSRVILGEYDTSTNPDCISDGIDSQICAPPTVAVDIEEQIPHEEYRSASRSRDRKHDIALLRLSSPVKFTDYIKPICLPNNSNITHRLWVAGWGATENKSHSNIKLKLSVPLADRQDCEARYGRSAISLVNSQICAGGQAGKDSCKGDSGGPLMSVERSADGTGRWTATGVVSFGPYPCGMPGWPGVYTKVSDYSEWIIRNIILQHSINIIYFEKKKNNNKMTERLFLFTFYFLLIFLFINKSSAQFWQDNTCYGRNNQVGQCINIRQCPPLLDLLRTSYGSPEAIQFLRDSQCGFEGRDPKVCCVQNVPLPTPPPVTTEFYNVNNGNTSINSRSSLLPSVCGRDLSVRIVGGERAFLDEFPWMVLLEYQKPNGRTTACGGVLISNRYVLTAAHCIKGKDLPKTWSLLGVRLGEHNTATDPDCIMEVDNTEICAPPVVTVEVEEQIAHEDYKPSARDQQNDIALLRLSSPVEFTDYIKPICLPNNGNLPQRLWVAGWGKTESRSESDVKLKLVIPIADRQDCLTRYGNSAVSLSNSQICAGGQRGKDSCRGDSGGPLMSVERAPDGSGKWTAVGVVSFGPSPCGMQGWPGIYTKVSDYTEWILRNMRP